MRRAFTKMHGLGNDFVAIDGVRRPFTPDPALLRWIADRHMGIGCDQVLVVAPPSSDDVDFDYVIYNADGSPSGQCGNGARCLAHFIRDQGLSTARELRVRTATSVMTLTHLDDGQVRVDMGAPRLAPALIPYAAAEAAAAEYSLAVPGFGEQRFGLVSLGNPHAVLRVDDVDSAPVRELGPALQALPAFPESVNVGFLEVCDPHHGRLRVYERGSGETLACGSGACAAAVSGILRGWMRSPLRLSLPGGDLQLRWEGSLAAPDAAIEMTGPAQTVFHGEFEWPTP